MTRFGVGDAVFGVGSGSFAEYAVALEDKLARAPANLTSSQAAAVPISGMTAMNSALDDAGHLEPGQHVLIIGASGGVGTYAVQLAKALERRHRRVQHGQDRSGPVTSAPTGSSTTPTTTSLRHCLPLRPDPRHRW